MLRPLLLLHTFRFVGLAFPVVVPLLIITHGIVFRLLLRTSPAA